MTKMTALKTLGSLELKQAYEGSWYTISGVGGSLSEWINGYEDALEKAGIGKPKVWYVTTGEAVNNYANPVRWQDAFKSDLTFLMFPLDGLNIGKLALFKLEWGDRWFDDIVDNMRDDYS